MKQANNAASPDRKLRFFGPADLLLLAAILLAGLGIFLILTDEKGTTAVISVDGSVVAEYPLSEDVSELTVEGTEGITLSISDGAISVISSDCPDKLCCASGAISRTGETIVCLPKKLSVEIVGGESDYDAVVG